MSMIRAVFENGVFRPTQPVQIPEHAQVEFEPRIVPDADRPALDEVYAVLSKRHESGDRDVAERHNEHQP